MRFLSLMAAMLACFAVAAPVSAEAAAWGQFVDEEVGGRAGADPDNAARYVFDRGTRHGLFQFVLSHYLYSSEIHGALSLKA